MRATTRISHVVLNVHWGFRLSRYLARSSGATLYPLLIASTLTIVFVIAVGVILLATGHLTLSLPALWLVQRLTGWNPSIDVSASSDTDPEPVPTLEQDPPPPDPEMDNADRPLLDLVGRLADHLTDHRRDNYEDNENDDDDW